MRLGIVTCESCRQLAPGEQALLPLFAEINIQTEAVVWNDPSADWPSYDALLIRSIWDYHLHVVEFAAWLSSLEAMGVQTWNPIPVLRWNSHKFYLRDLSQRGVKIIPTLFMEQHAEGGLAEARLQGWNKVVVKPAVSASAYRTATLSIDDPGAGAVFQNTADHGDFLVQPFMPEVQRSGELSIIFLNEAYSHTVLKRPQQGEFRVQKEYGGDAVPFQPEPRVIEVAQSILSRVGHPLLYARVDGIVVDHDFVLMELELIEPDLFLGSNPDAGRRFVQSLVKRLEENNR